MDESRTAITLKLWPSLRRAVIAYPITAGVLSPSGVVMRAVLNVCGKDATIVPIIGERLGGLAICAPLDTEVWRAELGLEYAP